MNDAMRGAVARGDMDDLWRLAIECARRYWRGRMRITDGNIFADAESRFAVAFVHVSNRIDGRNPFAYVVSLARTVAGNACRSTRRRVSRDADWARGYYVPIEPEYIQHEDEREHED